MGDGEDTLTLDFSTDGNHNSIDLTNLSLSDVDKIILEEGAANILIH